MKIGMSLVAATLGVSVVSACAQVPAEEHPAYAVGTVLGTIVASPFLIVKGLGEGIAATSVFAEADPLELNQAMVAARTPVDLARTYLFAYGMDLAALPANAAQQVFRDIASASASFQNVLRGYGVANPEAYLLTAVRTADAQGYTLYAVVYRPEATIRVRTEGGRIETLDRGDPAFYLPYQRDAEGRALDVVLDWAAVPRTAIRTQEGQALLMTIGANSVVINRRTDGYWTVENRWRRGEFRQIVREREASLAAALQ